MFEVKMNKVLNENEQLLEQVINKDIVNIIMNSSVDIASVNVHECEKFLKLETELLNNIDFVEKEIYNKLFKTQSQEKDTDINKLKERIKSISGKMNEDKIKKDLEEIETINIELDHREKVLVITILKDDLRKLKGKALLNNVVTKHTIDPEMLRIDVEPITPKLYAKLIQELLTKISKTCPSINNTDGKLVAVTPKNKDKRVRFTEPHSKLNANSELKCVKCNGCMLSDNHDLCVLDFINNVNARTKSKTRPTGRNFTIVGNACPLTRITTTTEVPFRKPTALDNETSKPVFCDSNLEVAFRKHICFIHNLEDVDLLTGSRGNNLYTLSFGDMMASSPISRHGLVRGIPKLKFEKVHLCYACAMGKSKKKPHKPKSEDTNQEKLYLLHMDLCGPMRVASVNGKKYILVIVNDYPRFTWVKFLRSKDKALDFIIKFLKMIQLRLKVPV
ncbi:retrovirus-related pol polyprotein from transposon TNT 1-94 [Tanacetum coccineum]